MYFKKEIKDVPLVIQKIPSKEVIGEE